MGPILTAAEGFILGVDAKMFPSPDLGLQHFLILGRGLAPAVA